MQGRSEGRSLVSQADNTFQNRNQVEGESMLEACSRTTPFRRARQYPHHGAFTSCLGHLAVGSTTVASMNGIQFPVPPLSVIIPRHVQKPWVHACSSPHFCVFLRTISHRRNSWSSGHKTTAHHFLARMNTATTCRVAWPAPHQRPPCPGEQDGGYSMSDSLMAARVVLKASWILSFSHSSVLDSSSLR